MWVCVCVYVCMCVCVYVYMCVCVCVCVYVIKKLQTERHTSKHNVTCLDCMFLIFLLIYSQFWLSLHQFWYHFDTILRAFWKHFGSFLRVPWRILLGTQLLHLFGGLLEAQLHDFRGKWLPRWTQKSFKIHKNKTQKNNITTIGFARWILSILGQFRELFWRPRDLKILNSVWDIPQNPENRLM